MPLDFAGLLQTINVSNEVFIPLTAYLREIYINEAPLLMRLPRERAVGETYEIVTYDVRPRTYTAGAALTTGATSLTLVDATPLLAGDVLEITSTDGTAKERVEVLGQVGGDSLVYATLNGTVVNIRRAREGTTAVANDHSANTTVTLIGNSRTGAEIMQAGTRAVRNQITQNVQTFQHPITMGGKVQSVQNVVLPTGVPSLFTYEQSTKVTEFTRDVEYSLYFGLGETPAASGDRAKMKGLRALIATYQSGLNINLTAGASYTVQNLIADTVQRCINGGGDPDILICSPNFLSYISTWTGGKQYFIGTGNTELGVKINSFQTAFIGRPIEVVPSYQLGIGTTNGRAFVCTAKDLKLRFLREEGWIRRATLGDASMGDLVGDFAVEVGHPSWHSFVDGITSVA